LGGGGGQKEVLGPDFNRSILVDFQGAIISSDTGFLVLREMDGRFDIIGPMSGCLEDRRSPVRTRHSLVQVIRQRVYQIGDGYEDRNDADHLRIDPALRLSIGKGHEAGASQSMLSRLENEVLGSEAGLKALDGALQRSTGALLGKRGKRRLIVDVDSIKDPAHGSHERVAYNGHFGTNCFHPLFAFTGEGACLGAKLRPGNVHPADGTLPFIHPIVERYRPWFDLFWLRGDAALASPEMYEYCEKKRITYFIRLPENQNLNGLVDPCLARPAGRPPRWGPQVKVLDFHCRAKNWTRPCRVVCKLEWPQGEIFPEVGFIVTNSRLPRDEGGEGLQRPGRCGEPDQGEEEHPSLGQDQLPPF
ncbi:MAG: IS1380 family transposase, partial [Nitrospinota bacterium]|nr:IS1380 family transposase [Nitrospinota bacterium]